LGAMRAARTGMRALTPAVLISVISIPSSPGRCAAPAWLKSSVVCMAGRYWQGCKEGYYDREHGRHRIDRSGTSAFAQEEHVAKFRDLAGKAQFCGRTARCGELTEAPAAAASGELQASLRCAKIARRYAQDGRRLVCAHQ
jgi:hypothetical protein